LSPIFSIDPAQNWADCIVFIHAFFCIVLLMGLVVWQPKIRAQLIKWRLICAFAVAVAVALVTTYATYGFCCQ